MNTQEVKELLKQCRSGYDAMVTRKLIPKLEEVGFTVVVPARSTLQVDIDDEEGYRVYKRAIKYLKRQLSIVEIRKAPSMSGYPRRHITLKSDKHFDDITKCYIQMILGSDFKREILGLRRILGGYEVPMIFIEQGWLEIER